MYSYQTFPHSSAYKVCVIYVLETEVFADFSYCWMLDIQLIQGAWIWFEDIHQVFVTPSYETCCFQPCLQGKNMPQMRARCYWSRRTWRSLLCIIATFLSFFSYHDPIGQCVAEIEFVMGLSFVVWQTWIDNMVSASLHVSILVVGFAITKFPTIAM